MKEIIVRYDLTDLPGDCRAFRDESAWRDEIRQAFADLGWRVTYHSVASSTNVEEEMLVMESEGEPLDSELLDDLLKRFGLSSAWFRGDGVRSKE